MEHARSWYSTRNDVIIVIWVILWSRDHTVGF